MIKSNRMKVIGVNFFLFALLFSTISYNKEVIRPIWGLHPALGILTGSFPNFIAAYLISLTPSSAVLLQEPKYSRLLIYGSSFVVFLILILEELRPMWGASTYYDHWDIVGSALGAVLAVLTYEVIVFARKKVGTKKHPGDDRGAGDNK